MQLFLIDLASLRQHLVGFSAIWSRRVRENVNVNRDRKNEKAPDCLRGAVRLHAWAYNICFRYGFACFAITSFAILL